ncbi:hypothetical protein ACU4GD_42170 [Cupriavidus basilensis]
MPSKCAPPWHALLPATGQPPLLLLPQHWAAWPRGAALAGRGAPPPCRGIVTLGNPAPRLRAGPLRRRVSTRARCAAASAWLRALAARETPRQRAALVSIFSWHDSIAGPAGTSWPEGAHHVPLAAIGHVSLLRHPQATQAVLCALAQLSAVAPAA